MQTKRPYVLSVAGFDPCSGAGLTADIKTFEQLKVYGLSVCTALTLQTEDEFHAVTWRKTEEIINETEMLLKKYPVKAVKFGITPSFSILREWVLYISRFNPQIKIIIDPVWKSGTGYLLNSLEHMADDENFLSRIFLITPNVPELAHLAGRLEEEQFIKLMRKHTSVLLKGGHRDQEKGTDILYTSSEKFEFPPHLDTVASKHGSGCVLSAAVTAFLAMELPLDQACRKAKIYTEKFLASNESLLGFHHA